MTLIYHITTMAAWESATKRSVYRADSLETEGFIHCSDAGQVVSVANTLFPGAKGLLLLHVDTDKLRSRVVYENLEGGEELFPHVYGPIEIDAVVDVAEFDPGPEGDFYAHHPRLVLSTFESLQTERLHLRPPRLGDAPDMQRLAGDRDVAKTVINIPHPYADGMAEQFIASTHESMARGRGLHLAITLRSASHNTDSSTAPSDSRHPSVPGPDASSPSSDDALIGMVGLQFDLQNRSAELGYWIGVPYWNNGYGTEAARAILHYGFHNLGLNRIHARHMTNNPASGRIMQKLGMQYEGTLRHAAFRFGSFEHLALYGLLRAEHSDRGQS